MSSGPTFVVAPNVRCATDAEIVCSMEPWKIAPLRDLNPGNWTAEEWPALLAGTLGPWACRATLLSAEPEIVEFEMETVPVRAIEKAASRL